MHKHTTSWPMFWLRARPTVTYWKLQKRNLEPPSVVYMLSKLASVWLSTAVGNHGCCFSITFWMIWKNTRRKVMPNTLRRTAGERRLLSGLPRVRRPRGSRVGMNSTRGSTRPRSLQRYWKSYSSSSETYRMRTEVNWMTPYSNMNLKRLNDVTREQRPSRRMRLVAPMWCRGVEKGAAIEGAAFTAPCSTASFAPLLCVSFLELAMLTPISAAFRAPLSLAPSPVMHTARPMSCRAIMSSCLFCGDMRAKTLPLASTSSRGVNLWSWRYIGFCVRRSSCSVSRCPKALPVTTMSMYSALI
eukprot:Colp12_sorted_trinity150504_noHs@18393